MNKPPVEKEVKFYIADLPALQLRLRSLGAELVTPRVFERNLRFDTPDLRLTASRQVLRLRQDNGATITYKGPSKEVDGVRVRQEIEIGVTDFDQARQLLESLGYSLAVVYEKWRTTYHYNGLEIDLDELPFGNFCEIEGEDTERIRGTSAVLALDWDARISVSYLGLFDELKRNLSLSVNNLTFEDFRNTPVIPKNLGVYPADTPRFL
jgi:adenylate cyclase, class 2